LKNRPAPARAPAGCVNTRLTDACDIAAMRAIVMAGLTLLPTLLAGCDSFAVNSGYVLSGNLATLMVTGRSGPDLLISTLSGRDCNVVNLDNRQPYCKPAETPPPPPTTCTASLGDAVCWQSLPPGAQPLADQPELTPAQQANIKAGWLEHQLGVSFQ
jgi:hypothetical protein